MQKKYYRHLLTDNFRLLLTLTSRWIEKYCAAYKKAFLKEKVMLELTTIDINSFEFDEISEFYSSFKNNFMSVPNAYLSNYYENKHRFVS